jgi:diguanylate cyclase (GGDEF)-like protein
MSLAMVCGLIRKVLLWCAGALALACAPAQAQAQAQSPFPAGSTCYADAGNGTSYAQYAATPERWNCSEKGWSIEAPRIILRFDLRGSDEAAPRTLVTRLTRFDRMRLTVLGADGSLSSRQIASDEMDFSTSDWQMRASLPDLGAAAEAVVVEIDGARHLGMITDAQLTAEPAYSGASLRLELLIAGLCGMLCVPLIFTFAFFRVLRERFVLWHAAAALCMLVHTFSASGIINHFFDLTMLQLSMISAYSWAGGVVCAGLFIADLIEPEKLDPLQRRLLSLLALWVPTWSTFYLFADGMFRPYSGPVYYASFIPVIALFIWVMTTGRMRGSRAITFQIAAWTPLMVIGAIRIASSFGIFGPPMEMQQEQHISIALEIIITSLGVADRFMIIKRQRDNALEQTKALEEIAERDPLTGLYNRHGIEERFEALHILGFDTMAAIDLDEFKLVNDNHGHAIGDEVLRMTAQALMPDENTLAVRMGGEEFLLLLRGKDAVNRAERRRQAITTRVAREMPGLRRMVTASMGLVEQPQRNRVKSDFITLYSHCDRLLYEAKRGGRNRTMSEKMQSFANRPKSKPAAA